MLASIIFVAEAIGTIAFAISGAMLAAEKNLDIFGILVLGIVKAFGGGVIRDLMLGITPPAMFSNHIFFLLAASALGGALLLTACDLAARLLFAPYEVPLGVVLSLAGGPFFLWLLLRQRGGRRT